MHTEECKLSPTDLILYIEYFWELIFTIKISFCICFPNDILYQIFIWETLKWLEGRLQDNVNFSAGVVISFVRTCVLHTELHIKQWICICVLLWIVYKCVWVTSFLWEWVWVGSIGTFKELTQGYSPCLFIQSKVLTMQFTTHPTAYLSPYSHIIQGQVFVYHCPYAPAYWWCSNYRKP